MNSYMSIGNQGSEELFDGLALLPNICGPGWLTKSLLKTTKKALIKKPGLSSTTRTLPVLGASSVPNNRRGAKQALTWASYG